MFMLIVKLNIPQPTRYWKGNNKNLNPPPAMFNVPRLPAVFVAGSFRQLERLVRPRHYESFLFDTNIKEIGILGL
jgi:hypothetical protein